MKRHILLAGLSAVAISISAPTFAKPGGGGGEGGGHGGGHGAGIGAEVRGSASAETKGGIGVEVRDTARAKSQGSVGANVDANANANANARVNSQGPANANIKGLMNASPNSVLSGAGVTNLTGLATGATVRTSAGAEIGTVTQIFTNRSGAVVGIQVDVDGRMVTIPATSLTMDGTAVVTSSTQF